MPLRSARSGALLVEAVAASFLLLFAFLAATRLFDASLQWESSSTNERLAALVAERKLEELRGWVALQCRTAAFEDLNWAGQQVTHVDYPEAPGFFVTVRTDLPIVTQPRPETGRAAIPPGVHSPSSQIFAQAAPGENAQKDKKWLTYPYTRHLDQSVRRVEILVEYGTNDSREFRIVSLLGDSIAPAAATVPGPFPDSPVEITGPNVLSAASTERYRVRVKLPNGQEIDDVTALWSLAPTSTGSAVIRPLDSVGREVAVTRSSLTPAGSGAALRLVAKVRYRGREIVGYSQEISLP
jgi:hypothetical protein